MALTERNHALEAPTEPRDDPDSTGEIVRGA